MKITQLIIKPLGFVNNVTQLIQNINNTLIYTLEDNRRRIDQGLSDGTKSITISSFSTIPAAVQTITNDSAISSGSGYVLVVGSGAVVLDTSPAIANGTTSGQHLILQGTSNTNTVTIADNCNCRLNNNQSFTMGDGDIIGFVWDTTFADWLELFRCHI